MVLHVREDHPAQPEHLVERGPLFIGAQQVPVGRRDPVAFGPQRLGGPVGEHAVADLGHVPGEGGERDREVVGPAAMVVVEAIAGGHVEPGVAGAFKAGKPAQPALAALGQRGQHRRRRAALGEQVGHPGLDRQPGQLAQLVVGPVHDHVDAGHHAGHRLVADLGERLLAELEEHHVGAVAEHQELGVVVPHPGEQVDAAVEVLPHVVVLRHPARLGDHGGIVELRKFGHGDRGDLVDQALDARLPALVQGVPVLVVVAGPLAEDRGPAGDLVGVGDRVGGDVDPPVHDPVLDAERGREDEHPRGIRPDRAVRDLGRDRVEGRHRLGEVHGVVEPEALVVVRLEPGEIRVHGPPALGARGVRDLRRKREPGIARVHQALLVTPLCAGPHRRRWHSGTSGSMAYTTFHPARSWVAPQREIAAILISTYVDAKALPG